MSLYFNENEQFPADWLRNLYPGATVDQRSIVDVAADDVRGFERCHFFGGIGGWEIALGLAGWEGEVWTGSCPCPPFSAAGQKKRCPACGGRVIPCPRRTGYFICIECEHAWHADGRHLWPEFWRLIRDCRPATVFGEQVASEDGRIWFAGVRASLERIGYAVGASDLAAASVGAPHIRQRLFWVADHTGYGWRKGHSFVRGSDCGVQPEGNRSGPAVAGSDGRMADSGRECDERRLRPGNTSCETGAAESEGHQRQRGWADTRGSSLDVGMANASSSELGRGPESELEYGRAFHAADGGGTGRLADSVCSMRGTGPADGSRVQGRDGVHERPEGAVEAAPCGWLGIPSQPRLEGHAGDGDDGSQSRRDDARAARSVAATSWSDFELIPCRGGKSRRTQSGLQPLVDGAVFRTADGRSRNDTSRPGLLKAIGNCIVPQVAAEFIMAFMETR